MDAALTLMSHSAQRLQQCFKALESDLAKSFEHTKEQPSGSRDRATNPQTQFSKQKDGALHHARHEVGSDKAPFDQVHYLTLLNQIGLID